MSIKLFLSSESVSYEQSAAFVQLVGKPLKDIRVAYIGNAADVADGDAGWIDANRALIEALGCEVTRIDLRLFKSGIQTTSLEDILKSYDVIWIGGGNTYYLRWILKCTRADVAIVDLIKSGKVYGGGSAGAIVAGPTIDYFQNADDPNEAEEIILDGLNLTELVAIPHWRSEGYGPIMKIAEEKLIRAGYKTQRLTNEQAIVIDGHDKKIVPIN